MAWLRIRRRAEEIATILEYPTDARRPEHDPRRLAVDPDARRMATVRRRVINLLLFVLFFVGCVSALVGRGGYRDLRRLQAEERALRQEIAARTKSIARLEREIDGLAHEPAARERIAREQLGLALPGEVLFLLPREQGRDLFDSAEKAGEKPGVARPRGGRPPGAE